MEREIIFCRVGKGVSKEGNNYYFIEYVKPTDFSIKRDYLEEPTEYINIEKKTKGKELQKVIGVLGVNKYDKLYIKDIK